MHVEGPQTDAMIEVCTAGAQEGVWLALSGIGEGGWGTLLLSATVL